MTQTDEMIGAPEAARRLGIDRSTLTRWVKAGRLDSYTKLPHRNGALVFEASAIDDLAQHVQSVRESLR